MSALAFSTLPRWARRMYGRPSGPLSDMAATAGIRATRLAFRQQRLFLGAMDERMRFMIWGERIKDRPQFFSLHALRESEETPHNGTGQKRKTR